MKLHALLLILLTQTAHAALTVEDKNKLATDLTGLNQSSF